MIICSVVDCGNKHYGIGYCRRHYNQIKNLGKIIPRTQRTRNDPNEIIIEGDICRMKLYNIKCEEVAETIFYLKYKSEIEKFKWYLKDTYALSTWYDGNGQHNMRLHQAIIYLSGREVKDDQIIDHKDTDCLNNLDDNLRICSNAQNQYNSKKTYNNISGSKGVSWSKRHKKWQTQIMVNYKQMHLGYFDTITEAARAYDAAAIKYFGEFAQINNI